MNGAKRKRQTKFLPAVTDAIMERISATRRATAVCEGDTITLDAVNGESNARKVNETNKLLMKSLDGLKESRHNISLAQH
jgi:hypothetical protein